MPSPSHSSLAAQTPTLVKDINTTVSPFDGSPAPGRNANAWSETNRFIKVGSYWLFVANDGISGSELWRTDGTAAGTTLVKDIQVGTGNSSPGFTYAQKIGSEIFITANDGTSGIELWKTDGTTAGTVLVNDIFTGISGSSPRYFVLVGSTMFFAARSLDTQNEELWKTDGTSAGTVNVAELRPGIDGSFPSHLIALG
ncbi:MAG TPA: hypothetical protein PKE00_14675, partial [Planctomycetota bacterium]|nr:hypothetical protein [Planctomycetota bacterium]